MNEHTFRVNYDTILLGKKPYDKYQEVAEEFFAETYLKWFGMSSAHIYLYKNGAAGIRLSPFGTHKYDTFIADSPEELKDFLKEWLKGKYIAIELKQAVITVMASL